MKRLLAFLTLVAGAATAAAQPQPGEPIKITASPAAAPVPALKYVLLPDLSERTPGNAVLLYRRAFSPEWWTNVRKREVLEKVEKASHAPVAELKNSDLRWLLDSKALREVDRAARREYCEWELEARVREEGIYLLLPDLQSMREFAMFLAARARLEMAEGRLDQALYTIQTGLSMARDVDNGPSLIQALVGVAVGNVMMAQIDELLRQPGAPNLYWALTDLPRPLIDLRRPLEGEKLWLFGTWPELRDLDNPYLSPRQRERLQTIAASFVMDRFEPSSTLNAPARLAVIGVVARAYPAAKRALMAAGRRPEEVEALSELQVVLIEALRDYDRRRDDVFKWMALPYPVALPHLQREDKAYRESKEQVQDIPIAQTMLPATIKVYGATTRLDRRIAALRCVEAVRLYAAAHDGKPPASLADVKDVPIPNDPMTDKPFEYKVRGDTLTLSAAAPPGEPAVAYNTLVYEVTLRK